MNEPQNPSTVYFIQGAPAIGKTAVMPFLRNSFPRGYFLEVDTIRSFVGQNNWDAHDDDYLFALETVATLIHFLIQRKKHHPIFVTDCLTETGIKTLTGYFKQPVDYKQIIIWANNAELDKRMQSRVDHPFKNREIALNMNDYLAKSYAKLDDENVFFLDTSNLTAEKTGNTIVEFINSGI